MKTKKITAAGVLAALASVIMFLEINIPFIPPFLKFDFSDVPALIGAIMYSPVVGICVIVVKNLVRLFVTITGGVGEIANIVMGTAFVLPLALLFRKNKMGAVASGIILMTVVSMFMNYFVLIPLYEKMMPLSAIIGMCSKVNPAIDSVADYIFFAVAPFNILKGCVNAAVACLIMKYMPKR